MTKNTTKFTEVEDFTYFYPGDIISVQFGQNDTRELYQLVKYGIDKVGLMVLQGDSFGILWTWGEGSGYSMRPAGSLNKITRQQIENYIGRERTKIKRVDSYTVKLSYGDG